MMKRLTVGLTAVSMAVSALAVGTANFTSLSDSATTPDLSANRGRGWYLKAQSGEWCSGSVANWAGGGNSNFPGQKFSLFYYEVSGASNDATVTANLACARAIGVKAIFAISYCSSNGCNEGKTLAQVQSDIASYKNVWEANKDVIAFIKVTALGGFGEWASWQGATPIPANVKSAVVTAFVNAAPRTVPLLMRNAPYIQTIYPTPLSYEQWQRNRDEQSKLGFFNDGFMGGPDDRSTFIGVSNQVLPNYTTNAASQRNYAAAFTNYAPFMIEPEIAGAGNVTRNHCDSRDLDNANLPGGIMNEGPRYHLTVAHRAYNAVYHDQWIAETCFVKVNNLMGHRFQLDSVAHATTVARGAKLRVTVNMRNVGWSRIFDKGRLVFTLDDGVHAPIVGTGSVQLLQLPPQATGSSLVYVDVAIPPGATPGAYSGYLSIPDVWPGTGQTGTFARYNVRFANADSGAQVYDTTKGRMPTGTSATIN